MKVSHIAGVKVLEPPRFADDRGYFCETWNERTASANGLPTAFVQDNESLSASAGTIRGIHFQTEPHAQGKLVRVAVGAALDVIVDLRQSSETFGRHMTVELSAENGKQVWVPAGLGHGFCTLASNTLLVYKVTDFYNGGNDRSVRFDDPALGIEWPVEAEIALLSAKDRAAPSLDDLMNRGDLFE